MIRRLMIVLVGTVVCLLATLPVLAEMEYGTLSEYEKATGKQIEKFNEAPVLRTKVAAGELVPLEQRLPEEPLVVEAIEKVGKYGGTLRIGHTTLTISLDHMTLNGPETLFKFSPDDFITVIPNVAKGYEMSSDGKTLTVYLRKGMKWSDGHPFTVDDILFWWEDYTLNEEISAEVATRWRPGGEIAKFEKVDDYTFRCHFAVPSLPILLALANDGSARVFLPKHYLQQFHPKYASKESLEKMMKEEGVDNWTALFTQKMRGYWYDVPVGSAPPDLNAYMYKETKDNITIYERNPYYWKVDTEGNQLPYIDGCHDTYLSQEILIMKIVAGEIDFSLSQIELVDFPFLKENEEKGGYEVLKWYEGGVKFSFFPNQNCRDSVLREIIKDRRFRIALSLAIDREKINELVFYGLGTPMQHSLLPLGDLVSKDFTDSYIGHDPEEANRLLDAMGLKWDKNHQWRLKPDGNVLSLTVMVQSEFEAAGIPQCEIIQKNWEEIGVKLNIDLITLELYEQRIYASEHEVGMWKGYPGLECEFYDFPRDYVPIQIGWSQFASEWARWYVTDGEEGEEPPEEIKRLYKVYETMKTTPDQKERTELAREILKSQAENLWGIGTIGNSPKPCIANRDLGNVADGVKVKPICSWTGSVGWLWNTCLWFFDK